MQIKSILVPTDGSNNAAIAMTAATDIAKQTGASIKSIYVVDRTPLIMAQSSDVINDAAKQDANLALSVMEEKANAAGVPYSEDIVAGDPAEAIIKESADHDIVVMSSIGKTGIKKAFLGSVSQKVAAQAKAPVLVVKPSDII